MFPNSAMTGHYDPTFVSLSVLIAVLSAYAALDLSGRVSSSKSRSARLAWLGGGAITMGIGIWSMHYIGMLAFRMPMMTMLYDWPTVLLSMLAAVAASMVALLIASRRTMGFAATGIGSLAMGGGIAAMHYIGMAAMRMPATMTYSKSLVGLSIALAVVIAFAALRITFATRLITTTWSWRKGLNALVMGLAIPVMHYTGMAAAIWTPSNLAPSDLRHAIGISDLGTASIALVTVVMLCLVFLAAIIDRRFSNHALEMEGSEERYRRIIASAFDAFIGVSSEGIITDWNEQATSTFGWSAEEALGRPIHQMVCADEEQVAGEENQRSSTPTSMFTQGRVETQARHKSGLLFSVEMAPSAIQVGNKQMFAVFVHDVTERKLVEQHMEEARASAEAANRAKSEFLANMSHEIRTPLNGVIGMTDLTLETELTRDQRDYLETVKLSADSLLGVINDILDFSKIEAGKIELEELSVDIRECVEATLKTVALRADEKGLELLCDINPDLPETIASDPGRLRQIITNLVGNAIKFTDEGEVSVTLRSAYSVEAGPLLHVTVADTGIGIAPEKIDKIFESFNQADTSTTRHYGGTGLGLTISRRLIEIMGGRIWVESQVGRGSQFHFEVPLKEATRSNPCSEVLSTTQGLAGVKVLIIDDNRTNRRILEGLLAQWGMNATSAADGESALQKLEEAKSSGEPFRLILTDMHMPKMDGFMVVQELQKGSQGSAATVMMLSSGGHRGDAAKCQELGIAAYLLKPVRRTELQEAIARALGTHAEEVHAPMITKESLQAERPSKDFLNILLAEDNEVNQKLAIRLLEKRGHTVAVAHNGRQAVQAVGARAYDLVLMDIQMPEMDGIEATNAIRDQERGTDRHQPIVAMTALVMKGDRERCLDAKMNGYLSKPIRPQELDAVLEAYTKHKRDNAPSPVLASAPAEAAIDLPDLLERVDQDFVFIAELTEVLREDCPRKLAIIRDCLEAADAQGLKRAAHGLKGALSNLSAKPAAAIAAKLEALGTAESLTAAHTLIPQLTSEITRALETLSSVSMERAS